MSFHYKFLPLQINRELNISHSLQSLHLVHVISNMKIYSNFKKNLKTLHQNSYIFKKFYYNL
jgi:hypothetical protein